MIKEGDKIPSMKLMAATADGPREVATEDVFDGKRIVLFGVPGAFTPTCTAKHLPGFIDNEAVFREKGVDQVACVAVNDVFVMGAWARQENVGESILMLADGSGSFIKALGLELDLSARGMGIRSQRFALVARDRIVERVAVEKPGEFDVSRAENVLAGL